jgi:hypothetical protein
VVSRAGPDQVQPAGIAAAHRARAKRGHVLLSNDETAIHEECEVPSAVTVESQVRPCRLVNSYRISKENIASVFSVYAI